MKLLSHSSAADYQLLKVIDSQWPVQFLPGFTAFHKEYFNDEINIVFDEKSNAYLPLRFHNLKLFRPAQILHAPVRDKIELDAEEQLEFFNNLIHFLKQKGKCERLVQPHPYGILASIPKGAKSCEFGTYVINLESQTEQEILEKFHPKYQKAISHSERNGAVVKLGRECLEDFFMIYENTMKRVGLFIDDFEYFKTLYKCLGEDHACAGVVYDNGVPISGIFVIFSKYAAFLTHAGSMGESKLYGAAKLLNFEMMKHLKAKGIKRYDFVGVRLNNNNPALEGIFRYKKGFGGELKAGYLWKIDIMPLKAKAYDLLLQLKSKGKETIDIIDQINT